MLSGVLVALVVIAVPAAQPFDAVLSDTRLSVHTLVREDIFAGFKSDNLPRLERGERHIEILLTQRPEERGNLLAWKAGAAVYRAVIAHESGQATSGNGGVAAITGGTLAVCADRLPEPHRAAAWALAYDNFSQLWKEQGADIEKLPVHHRGEILSGLTQSAQRTGRTADAARFLDRMLIVLAGTPYEPLAKQWKADPAVAATTNLTCRNCHNPGRLDSRIEALNKKGIAD